ncbi:heme-binding protein 2-like [Dreissena polymorpha]|uniref:Heme-binding protein 2 n=1 Tax=Dreissena polymorpha TaxID=45954 RepID=A0A9D4L6P7_DREPO|nr:heme-binding protein 2-like [Dreissena polymorpha]KAH3852294.1 hypothetical protein DPMN_094798 [Dreissena polymorpha]
MDKAALVFMFITFGTANHVPRSELQNSIPGLASQKPAFCNGMDCPEFTVVKSTKDYEIRDYVATDWVSTDQLNMEYKEAWSKNFMKLSQYISGQNDKMQKVAMTFPVVTRIIPGQESNFRMNFFVAPAQKPAPKPTNPEVFLQSIPTLRVYARRVAGYARDYPVWKDEAVKLEEALTKDGLEFVTEKWWTASYDAPFNRHNEVIFMAK